MGDARSAAQALVWADRLAPAEVRHRPTAREVAAQVARCADAAATLGRGPGMA
ncbi:hypothetical protein [Micromonospora sp. WMMD998]|uniref:hypothetical protein n=1 Tax=Micromonospora sp. WMMD998 TaxID=3016092 RepID=UPI00249AEE14|nr:hypothetical protein [Micromonospora sp. WMMD998]WFE40228.1 hypothetical protein O7619_17990 [Micromonospora sp. WMMD998]